MSTLNIPVTKREEFIQVFKRFGGNIPSDYKTLCKSFMKKSCIPLFLRVFPLCQNCRHSFDDTHMFCMNCLKKNIKSPLYHPCRVDGCICNISIKDCKDFSVDKIKTMECSHSRRAFFSYAYYIPPIGIIADLIHNSIWNQFMGITEDSISRIAQYCNATGCYSQFTSLNMMDICKEFGFEKAAACIKRIHDFHISSLSTSVIAGNSSLSYYNLKHECSLSGCIFFIFLIIVIVYNAFFVFIGLKNMNEKAVLDFESEWLTNVCQDIVFSTAFRKDIDWNQEKETLIQRIEYIFHISLVNCFSEFGYNVNKKITDKVYTLYNSLIKGFVNMVFSIRDLHNNRFDYREANKNEIKKVDHFLDSPVSKSLLEKLSTEYSILQSKADCKNICMSSIKRLCTQIKERYSECDYNVPVNWLREARTVMKYFKLRCYLMKIFERVQVNTLDSICLTDVESYLYSYYHLFCDVTGLSNSNYPGMSMDESCVKSVIISNIKILKDMVWEYKGLDSQYDLLCQIESKLHAITNNTDIPDYDMKELLEPCFTPCFDGSNRTDINLSQDSIKKFLDIQYDCVHTDCINHFVNELAVVTISCDDVEVFKSSQNGRSTFVLECFFCGVPYFLHFTGKNCWFSCILPATKPRELENGNSKTFVNIESMNRISIKRQYRELDQENTIHAAVDMIYDGIVDNRNVEGVLLKNVNENFVFCRSQTQLSPANWLGREITTLVLRDFKFLGECGIPILFKDTIHYVFPSVLAFRFDNPAGDLLANSNGKQASNMPCRDCQVKKCYWNKHSNTLTYADGFDVLDDKKNRIVFVSTLTSLERDDLYRIISLISLFHEGDEYMIMRMLEPDESEVFDNYCIEEIKRLLVICDIEHIVFWIPPTSVFYPPNTDKYVQGTNPVNSVGRVELEDTPSGRNTLKSKDKMHIQDNTGKEFIEGLKKKKNTKQDSNTTFVNELQRDGIIPSAITITSSSFTDYSIYYARFIYEENKQYLPLSVRNIIESIIPGRDHNGNPITVDSIQLNSHQKLHFTLIYSQFLFPASVVDHFLFSYVRFFNVLGRIYCCRSDLHTFHVLYREMIFLLNMIENEKFLNSCTINDHLYIHDDLSYQFVGPSKEIDCYEPEWSFFPIKKTIPTPNSLVTLYKKQMDITITSLFCPYNSYQEESLSDVIKPCDVDHFYKMSFSQFAIRVISCYNSSCRYKESCTSAIITLWDIEATSTLENYINGGFINNKVEPRLFTLDNNYFPSQDTVIEHFASITRGDNWRKDITLIPALTRIIVYQKCHFHGINFKTQNTPYPKMKNDDYLNSNNENTYGIIIDYKGFPHLVTFLAFFSVPMNGKDYIMTYCHNIPISFLMDQPTPYVFKVNKSCKKTPVHSIISMDRIHPVIFVKAVSSDDILGINNKTFTAQYI